MTALLVVIMAFSAIGFLFTVQIFNMAGNVPILYNYVPIEGTDLAVKYSTLEPSGIYKGPENTAELILEGDFGYDWGAALIGDTLYINEYRKTTFGLVLCDVIKVDTNTFAQEVLCHNAILRGQCASGELVCVGDTFLPSNVPENNSLCKLYSMTSGKLKTNGDCQVFFIDPDNGETVYSVTDENALTVNFKKKYLIHTLEEVKR